MSEPIRTHGPTTWTTPGYADPSSFNEFEVTIGRPPLSVPATLCVPIVHPPSAGVVLLPGSGPTDRDSTIGPNKPFKDLAWGLATHGIATVRFDKVTLSHPAAVAARTDFTAADEYLPYAAAAIAMVGRDLTDHCRRIFLVGHSQGASIASRIAERHPELAGIVSLAAPAQPLHHAAIRQLRYLAALAGTNGPDAQAIEELLDKLNRQASVVDDDNLSEATATADLPFGVSAQYWLDLRANDPLRIAAGLDLAMLFLQGGRDYQVTVEDDMRIWRSALADRSNVEMCTYPDDDHCFFPGTEISTPISYRVPQHVDEQVVNHIATWIARIAHDAH